MKFIKKYFADIDQKIILLSLVAIESAVLFFLLSGFNHSLNDAGWVNAMLPVRSGIVLSLVFCFFVIKARQDSNRFEILNTTINVRLLMINLLAFVSVLYCVVSFKENLIQSFLLNGSQSLYVLYGLALSVFVYSISCLIVSERIGRVVIHNYGRQIVFLSALVLVLYNFPILPDLLGSFWFKWFGNFTVESAVFLTKFVGLDPQVNWIWYGKIVNFPVIETANIKIGFTQPCSGFQSIGLYLMIMLGYLLFNKHTIGLQRSIVLFLTSIIFLFVFNIVRVAFLVVIADRFSYDIAMNGFHSSSGWFYLIIITALSIFALDTSKSRVKNCSPNVGNNINNYAQFEGLDLVVPLMIYIGSSIIVKMATGQFNWLYPVPVVITGAYLFYKWHDFRQQLQSFGLLSVLIGVVVGVCWVYFIPDNAAYNASVDHMINSTDRYIFLGWLVFRVIGAIFVVPFIEEIAFRGYIFHQINTYSEQRLQATHTQSQVLAVLASGFLYGLFHSDMIAATLEGVTYGLIRAKAGRISDAIICHGTANAVLALYVMNNNSWSYW